MGACLPSFDVATIWADSDSVARPGLRGGGYPGDCDGTKEVLGLWFERSEGAKFWLRAINELGRRGVADVLFAVVDGLTRHSPDFASGKDRKHVTTVLKSINRAADGSRLRRIGRRHSPIAPR